jgi:hypothetical protein
MMEKVATYRQHPDVVVIALAETISSNIVLAAPIDRKLAWPTRQFLKFVETKS